MTTRETFKILTFNCWGVFVPFCTVRKEDRFKYMIERFSEGTYDILMLQEIWTDNDYQTIRKALKSVYPYAQYFHSKLIGAGICIFSKWPIDSTFFHAYGVNGYPHMVHQADWFCGKGVGLARVTSRQGFRVNLYVTHLVARYELDRRKDPYDGHRVAQMVELAQLIRMTSNSADAYIVTGDFNLESDTGALHLFRKFLDVSDAWLDNVTVMENHTPVETLEIEGCTCDRLDNPYHNETFAKFYGNGERLDYIFYRVASRDQSNNMPKSESVQLTCQSCWLDMRKVPGDANGLHYSDHEGVGAQFTLERSSNEKAALASKQPQSLSPAEPLVLECTQQLNAGMKQCKRFRQIHIGLFILVNLIILLLVVNISHYNWLAGAIVIAASALMGTLWFILAWGSFIGHTAERRALENALLEIATFTTDPLSQNKGDGKLVG